MELRYEEKVSLEMHCGEHGWARAAVKLDEMLADEFKDGLQAHTVQDAERSVAE
jgi:hypothetical protein